MVGEVAKAEEPLLAGVWVATSALLDPTRNSWCWVAAPPGPQWWGEELAVHDSVQCVMLAWKVIPH